MLIDEYEYFQIGMLLVFEISVFALCHDISGVLYEAAISILHIRSSSSVLASPKLPKQLGDL